MLAAIESPDQPEVIQLIADLDAYQDGLYPADLRRAPFANRHERRCRRAGLCALPELSALWRSHADLALEQVVSAAAAVDVPAA